MNPQPGSSMLAPSVAHLRGSALAVFDSKSCHVLAQMAVRSLTSVQRFSRRGRGRTPDPASVEPS